MEKITYDTLKTVNACVDDEDTSTTLRVKVLNNLKDSGFIITNNGRLIVPRNKDYLRKLHNSAVEYILNKNRDFILKHDSKYLDKYIINGRSLDVKDIHPTLIQVKDKDQSELFRWIKMHWSIPISAGYGRRLRYIVKDQINGAIIGIIGLADPVYALGDRDRYIGWSPEQRKKSLKHIMDAFVLGAVPPYSMVLGGKLVASLLGSPEIRKDFYNKYQGRRALISGNIFNGKLAAITTASALGKSSIYDRITIPGGIKFVHAGWTKGSGEFQFSNGLYNEMKEIAYNNIKWTKNPLWGTGIRNKRVIVREALRILNLPMDLNYHNIKRELFFISLSEKSLEFLRGQSEHIDYFENTKYDISNYIINRWMIPRSERYKEYIKFNKDEYSLIKKIGYMNQGSSSGI